MAQTSAAGCTATEATAARVLTKVVVLVEVQLVVDDPHADLLVFRPAGTPADRHRHQHRQATTNQTIDRSVRERQDSPRLHLLLIEGFDESSAAQLPQLEVGFPLRTVLSLCSVTESTLFKQHRTHRNTAGHTPTQTNATCC